jgi:hypothetical protein
MRSSRAAQWGVSRAWRTVTPSCCSGACATDVAFPSMVVFLNCRCQGLHAALDGLEELLAVAARLDERHHRRDDQQRRIRHAARRAQLQRHLTAHHVERGDAVGLTRTGWCLPLVALCAAVPPCCLRPGQVALGCHKLWQAAAAVPP